MSLSNNYPNAIPSLVLDFANTKKLDPRVTFTRASTATFYDGKTVAKAEENLVQRSDDFTVAGWIKSAGVVSANTTTAPDGTTTAETFTANSGTVAPYIISDFGPGMSANTQATHSIFVKKNTHDFVQVWVHNGGANSYANFDVNTGVTGNAGAGVTNHTITSVGNGWYRCSMTFTATSTSLGVGVAIVGSTTATRLQTFSAAGTESIYIWGAQTEARGFLTAYTATTTAPITNYIPALQTAASGVARFDHNPVTGESLGLEIEEQRTNLLLRSEEYDNASWTKANANITTNTVVAPDGMLTADAMVETTASAQHYVLQTATATLTSALTLSVYAKLAYGSRYLGFTLANQAATTNGVRAIFNLSSGTVLLTQNLGNGTGVSTSITHVGNGWYRCTLSGIPDTSGTTARVIISLSDSSAAPTPSYAGDGWSALYLWGAQLEAGSFATSYIKTEGSQVTRSADSASMTGTNFSSWYRADEGTVYMEAVPTNITTTAQEGFLISDRGVSASQIYGIAGGRNVGGGGGQSISFWVTQISNQAFFFTANSVATANTAYKIAGTYKVNDFAASFNGASASTDTSGITPLNMDRISWGNVLTSPAGYAFSIKKFAFYPKRLTNAELVSLSTI